MRWAMPNHAALFPNREVKYENNLVFLTEGYSIVPIRREK
jgi:hypothetical protein